MTDPAILQYLKSIDDRTARMETRIDDTLDKHSKRLNDHDKKFERQAGVMIGGGAVVSLLSGLGAWIIDHFTRNG